MALTLPIMAFSLLGAADMARAFAVQLAVQNGARAGAESSALDVTPTGAEATARVQDEISRTPGITSANATVTVTYTLADGTSVCTGPPARPWRARRRWRSPATPTRECSTRSQRSSRGRGCSATSRSTAPPGSGATSEER